MKPVKSFLIMISIIAALFVFYMIMANILGSSVIENARTPEEQEQELARERELFPKLDEKYDASEYEALIELANSPEFGNIDIWNYGHYDLLNYYGQYIRVRDEYIPMLDSKSLSAGDARRLTEIIFSFYYRCYDHTLGSAGNASDNDLKVLDDIRDGFILDILYNRMGYTEDDMEAARNDIMESNYFHTAVADKFSDKYSERYR